MTKNPYEVLGIREGADMDEIKRAYRKMAKAYHPDLHPNDPTANAKMQQINEAYDMLCNPDKYRAQQQPRPDYDTYRQADYDGYARQGRQYGPGGWQYTYYSAGNADAYRAWQQAWRQAEAEQPRRRARLQSPAGRGALHRGHHGVQAGHVPPPRHAVRLFAMSTAAVPPPTSYRSTFRTRRSAGTKTPWQSSGACWRRWPGIHSSRAPRCTNAPAPWTGA